ncbi:MAG: UDP-N-acetylmuramyl peptide synthase [Legionella sp.]|uniref:UDP-N-acetylmuramyl peptide synthase n=1 Tax=Legionella sp. TaxID=459 RepID=UPI0039E5CC20
MPVKEIKEIKGFKLTFGKKHYYFCGAEPPINTVTSCRFCKNKYITNRFLEAAEIPVPKATIIEKNELTNDQFLKSLKHLKYPLVVKPGTEAKGKDVFCNLQTIEDVRAALTEVFATYDWVIVEEFHAHLSSYRVLVFNQRILGVIKRYPAHVIGDGTHTIEELITQTNKERKKINEFLAPIALDQEAYIALREQELNIDYIPKVSQKINLGYTSNASRGGTYETLSKRICKENRKLMIHVANVLGLELIGIDVECNNINIPITYGNGVVIEANFNPSVRIHELPISGPSNLVTRKIIRSLIYRHPLAYLCSLYFNKQTAFYIRSFIVAIIIAMILPLLAKG